MSKKIGAIHFGAGNIGRGLIADFYLSNNVVPIFIDTNNELVQHLKKEKKYEINYDDGSKKIIDNFDIFLNKENIDDIFKKYEIKYISTSIGTKNFQYIKELLESIFNKLRTPINVIAFENDFLASDMLKKIMNDNENNYINALVDRIIPIIDNREKYYIYTEKYFEIVLDKKNDKDNLIKNNVFWTDDFKPYLFRKLWIINSTHLMLGFLFKDERKYVFELMEDEYPKKEFLVNLLNQWFKNISIVLNKEYNFNLNELKEYIDKNKKRIFNKKIKDELKRLRRDPIKKLQPNERVFSLYDEFKKYDLDTSILKELIYKMITEIDEDDQQSNEIKKFKENNSLEKTLIHFSKIDEKKAEEILKKHN